MDKKKIFGKKAPPYSEERFKDLVKFTLELADKLDIIEELMVLHCEEERHFVQETPDMEKKMSVPGRDRLILEKLKKLKKRSEILFKEE